MDLIKYLIAQKEWSEKTFGLEMRTKGITNHIRSELLEIEEAPDDVMEWLDVIILAFDGAWRCGASLSQICEVLRMKQKINFNRTFPKPESENHKSEHERNK